MPTVEEFEMGERAYLVKCWFRSVMGYLGSEDRSGDPSKVHVLYLSYECPRRRFLRYQFVNAIGSVELKSIDTINRFLSGRLYHEVPMFPNGEHEIPLIWEGIVGHPDDYDPINHILVDKKTTTNPPRGGSWSDPIKEPTIPYSGHIKQVEYYKIQLENGTDFNGIPSKRPVRAIYIIYIKSDDPYTMPMPCKVELKRTNAQIMTEMRTRRDELERAILDNKIPLGNISWECRYCEFFNVCFDKKFTERWHDEW